MTIYVKIANEIRDVVEHINETAEKGNDRANSRFWAQLTVLEWIMMELGYDVNVEAVDDPSGTMHVERVDCETCYNPLLWEEADK